ncbi:MAG: trehalose-phosphatase [Parvibaculum sp.]|jgi:trehalose 6-phosphate phosphatase|uniref:trehalose-phosphatase n=1 Tax=Parvibaculum sp. TaxID=2024848 RepID=UPI002AB8BE33|nr:trehalose-phosphatase [Parvibaculum sp.]MDZ4382698.1 trehalose-phosphatase [Parvibaculum sp.]
MNDDGHALPAPQGHWALFLDFDGTLAELAPTPGAVVIDPGLPDILLSLTESLGGAVALISGRPLVELDRLTGLELPGAGVHGLELRERPGMPPHMPDESRAIRKIAERLAPLVAGDRRLILEEKPGALALHYRRAPEREAECRTAMKEALAVASGLEIMEGKMVIEVKPGHANKGHAIEKLMSLPPFLGRIPVFAGDDRTDEDGFGVVNALKGVTIKIGDGETKAAHRLPSVEYFVAWLKQAASSLRGDG